MSRLLEDSQTAAVVVPEPTSQDAVTVRTREARSRPQQCSDRTRAAIERLFIDGNHTAIVGELRMRVSHAEAEDLVQRAVERALSGRCQAEHVAGAHAWVRQDALFGLSHLMKRRQVAQLKMLEERSALPRPNELPGPEDGLVQLGNVQLGRTLVMAAQLSRLDQQIILLYWGQGLPRRQVAQELGVAEGMLKKRLMQVGALFEALLIRRCGGGCSTDGEEHVRAYAFRHRGDPEHLESSARAHLEDCSPCTRLFSRLEEVRLSI